jgi:hypothetical protein
MSYRLQDGNLIVDFPLAVGLCCIVAFVLALTALCGMMLIDLIRLRSILTGSAAVVGIARHSEMQKPRNTRLGMEKRIFSTGFGVLVQ